MTYSEICQSIVGTTQKTNHGDTVKVLKYWVSTRGKDMLWIETTSKKRLDVEAWYITDKLSNITKDIRFIHHVESVIAKLINEGLAKSNYSRAKAREILSHTVAPVFCEKVLTMYEDKIIESLPKTPKQD